MKKIVASGPVIIEKGKLLVTKDTKDDFYKIPGGMLERMENPEDCAIRKFEEETGLLCYLTGKLPTMRLTKNPETDESMKIKLYHYGANLATFVKNYNSFYHNEYLVAWLDIEEIKQGRYNVAPNIKFLIEKGSIK